MAANSYGLDADYLEKNLKLLVDGISYYKPDEAARALLRLVIFVKKEVINEPEFTGHLTYERDPLNWNKGMSNMLDAILRMPIELWTDSDLDKLQRHGRYIEAANLIKRLTAERDALKANLDVETHMAKLYKSDWEDLVQQRDLLQEDFSDLEKSYERLAAERNALQIKLNGGVRVYAAKNGLGYGCVQLRGDEAKDHNATLILDEGNEPPNTLLV